MRLANLYWMDNEISDAYSAVNYGDILQFEIISYILNSFFPNNDIKWITTKEVSSYRGEMLVLPLNWSLFDINYMKDSYINISPNIIPIFLAMTVESGTYRKEYINEYNLSFLKRFEPIGCRDARTRDLLLSNGVKSYLNGCLTSAFAERKSTGKKILLIDVPEKVKNHMPNWDNEIEIFTQQEYFSTNISIEEIWEIVRDRYEYYYKEAELIVTSRLHIASPCMAVGIPVVFVKDIIDARLPWMRKYLPLYDQNTYDSINWNPKPIRYEATKELILKNAVNRIKSVLQEKEYETYYQAIDALYKDEKESYPSFKSTIIDNYDKVKDFLMDRYSYEETFSYAIWGVCEGAENVYRYISLKYNNARLTSVVDMYKRGVFHGIEIEGLDTYHRKENEIMIVVPVQASNAASKSLEKMGFSKNEFVCSGELFINEL